MPVNKKIAYQANLFAVALRRRHCRPCSQPGFRFVRWEDFQKLNGLPNPVAHHRVRWIAQQPDNRSAVGGGQELQRFVFQWGFPHFPFMDGLRADPNHVRGLFQSQAPM